MLNWQIKLFLSWAGARTSLSLLWMPVTVGWSLKLATKRIWLYRSFRGMCIDFKPLEIHSSAKWPWNYIIELLLCTHSAWVVDLSSAREIWYSLVAKCKTNVCCSACPLSRYNALSTRVTHSLPQSSRTVMCRLISRVWSWARWPWISCRRRSMSSFITWRSLWNRSTLCFYWSSQRTLSYDMWSPSTAAFM